MVQGRVWRFYRRNKERLDPLSGLINLITPCGKQQTYVYNMHGVMEFYRFSTQPGGFMAFETIWNFCTFFVYLFKITRLDSLSSVVKMSSVESNRTVAHDVICYSLRSVMEICRYNTNPKTNALIDCIYHSQAPSCRAPIPCWVYATAIHLRHISALYDAFGRFSPVLAYFALHLFRTGWN